MSLASMHVLGILARYPTATISQVSSSRIYWRSSGDAGRVSSRQVLEWIVMAFASTLRQVRPMRSNQGYPTGTEAVQPQALQPCAMSSEDCATANLGNEILRHFALYAFGTGHVV